MSSEASLFPVFLKLEGRAVVLVGGGAAARVKLSELIRAGARVTVVAPEVRPEISSSGVTVVQREFVAGDLDDAWFVVAAAPPEVNRRVAAAACGSRQKRLDHWGSATCTVRCITSPGKTASPSRVRRRTDTWPGVWPREDSSVSQGSTACVAETSSACPASTTGTTLSAMQPYGSRPLAASHFQNSHSSPANR